VHCCLHFTEFISAYYLEVLPYGSLRTRFSAHVQTAHNGQVPFSTRGTRSHFLGQGGRYVAWKTHPLVAVGSFVKTYISANSLSLLTVLPNCRTICGAQNVSPYVHRSLSHLQIEEHVMKENREGEVTCYCNMFT
jgi:hypothetical protein